ncbi:MAG: DUF167 domain-containing protein [Acidobacteria bacterium]|nr:DUF167 domain-containing protein [Acidobacteriota bacterium]
MDTAALQTRLQAQGKLTLHLRVIPKSPRTAWSDTLADGSIKLRVAAVPERGKANEEIVRFLSREFSIPRNHIEILAGATSSTKLVRLTL